MEGWSICADCDEDDVGEGWRGLGFGDGGNCERERS